MATNLWHTAQATKCIHLIQINSLSTMESLGEIILPNYMLKLKIIKKKKMKNNI